MEVMSVAIDRELEKVICADTFGNVVNHDWRRYNCGGYALGTYTWYLPHNRFENREVNDFIGGNEYNDLLDQYYDGEIDVEDGAYADLCNMRAEYFVDTMVKRGVCRRIESESELRSGERLVAFRASVDDFHYIRKMSNGEWTHKMGAWEIGVMDEYDVMNAPIWECSLPYGGNTILLAVSIAAEQMVGKGKGNDDEYDDEDAYDDEGND